MANEQERRPPCLDLRFKQMFYRDLNEPLSEYEARQRELYGPSDTNAYWCQRTQTGRGPDEQPVNRAACSCADRKCYKSLLKNLT